MSLKILHVVEAFGGGVFNSVKNICNYLSDYKHIILYGIRKETPNNFEKFFKKNTSFIYWQHSIREVNFIKDKMAAIYLSKIYKLTKPDIIHLHSSKAGYLGRIVSTLMGLHKITLYSPRGLAFLQVTEPIYKRVSYMIAEKILGKLPCKIIACSKSEAKELNKIGVKVYKIINNGIKVLCQPIPKFKKADNLTIGTVGRITAPKNPVLFNKIASFFSNRRNIKFIWIGDGELRNLLTSPNIYITGWLDKNKVFSYIQKLDIFIMTSLWEGLPLAGIEALAVGKPLVVSNSCGCVDLVKEGINGYICNSFKTFISSIENLILQPELRYKFSINSQKIYKENFTLEKTIKEWKLLYEKVANNKY